MKDRTQFKLSPRELEILGMVVDDLCTNREIAERTGIVEQVAKKHLEHIYSKVGLTADDGVRKRIRLWRMFRRASDQQITPVHFTDCEWVMMTMVSEGAGNHEIAERLQMSEGTVKNYIKAIFDRAGVWNRLELAAWVDSHYRPEAACAAD